MKKLISLVFFAVLVFVLPRLAFADDTKTNQPLGSLVSSSESIIYDVMDNKELAVLPAGSSLFYSKVTDEKVYIQWGDHLASLNKDDLTFADSPKKSLELAENQSIGTIKLLKDTAVYTSEGKKLVLLKAGIEYPYDSINRDGNYQIVMGNQIGYLSKDNVESVQSDTSGKPRMSDNKDNNSGPSTDDVNDNNKDNLESPNNDHADSESGSSTGNKAKSGTEDGQSLSASNQAKKKSLAKATIQVEFNDYFKATKDNVPVYNNERGSQLVQVGTLKKGQVYKRISDYGNWHRIQFENGYGYVAKSQTTPASGNDLKNINKSYKNTKNLIKILKEATVYDNSSGSLVPFAVIKKGETYPIVNDYGNWYRVLVSGRVGYVSKGNVLIQFSDSDKYFESEKAGLPVYNNQRGSKLVQVGTLQNNQTYQRVSDYGNWQRIQFGNAYGYVSKSATLPSDSKAIKNLNSQYKNGSVNIKALTNVTVYDNSSSSGLVPFATILKGEKFPLADDYDYGNWYRVLVSGRIGYIRKSEVQKMNFTDNDKFFLVTEKSVPVYNNERGSKLVKVGTLEGGQAFERVSDYGNWHRVQFENGYGYVKKSNTLPDDGKSIKNLNKNYKNINAEVAVLKNTLVYDNTSGQLVPFASILKGEKYPVVSDYGNWYRILVSGRVGYVNEDDVLVQFNKDAKYFEVAEDKVPVYNNQRSKNLIQVGSLEKGQVYQRVSDYGNWQRIQFGDEYGYIEKNATLPNDGESLKNLNTKYKISSADFQTVKNLQVYDNSSGTLVPFATINKGESFPLANDYDYGNWYRVIVSNRVGYVRKSDLDSVIDQMSQYGYSLYNMVSKQMKVNPQTDQKIGYISVTAIGNIKNSVGTIQGDSSGWFIRSQPSTTTGERISSIFPGAKVRIIKQVSTDDPQYKNWYEIEFGSGSWEEATEDQVIYYVDPDNFDKNSDDYFQFLKLSDAVTFSLNDTQKLLKGNGSLDGTSQAQAFIDAAKKYNVNEIYLISHAFLETGHGTSDLASGVKYNGETVYNMFGISALDHCAVSCGAEYAYQQGWTTPAKAILGGAQWISDNYIHNGQDTLYKMRWNPASPASHQYASDIGWAVKQTDEIAELYDLLAYHNWVFDVPSYSS
ncbi:hypothetical protein GCM10011391_38880 [Pullulanibacillus camelliae]|uniref:Uncharacterized protein n=1 Tax=Pullulanibacillus camelliae TaxID=1707096 RepID=A0A8J3E255_9BACL|nr:N-acetylglucosaminidase [Pullulanibacillus camelliae]GGE56091.1 hypothetical protein GCM10011391_38880 [Pullulanibacillus camelliae]